MMLKVAGSQVQRPLSPFTEAGANGGQGGKLVNRPAFIEVTALTTSPWTAYPRLDPVRTYAALGGTIIRSQVSPSKWSTVTDLKYRGASALVAYVMRPEPVGLLSCCPR